MKSVWDSGWHFDKYIPLLPFLFFLHNKPQDKKEEGGRKDNNKIGLDQFQMLQADSFGIN